MVDERKLPEGWGIKKLSEVAPLQRGFDLPTGKIKKGSYPVVYSNGISNYHNEFKVKGPGVITGRSGTIGKVHYSDGNYWPHNTALWVTDFKDNNPRFIYYLYTYVNLEKFATGSGVPTLNRNDVHSFEVLVPSCSEQKSIAEALSDTDNLIQSYEKLINKKKKIKQGAMQQLLTGKKRLPGFSGDWEIKKLGEIARMQSGGTPRTEVKQFYSGNIPWASINDMTASRKYLRYTEKKITQEGLDKSSAVVFPEDTILYAMYASIGECVITKKEVSSSQAILGIQCYDQILCVEYLYYYLSFIKCFMRTQGQTGTQSNLNKNMVQNINITLPSIEEQKAIAQVLSDMDAEIEALEEKLKKVKTIKQGMMQELLTGRIRLI